MLPLVARVLLSLTLLSLPAVLSGADASDSPSDNDYALKVWETDDGLPHNSISSVVQRADGFIWVATQGGLVRFDGLQFTPLSSPLIEGADSASVVSLIEQDSQTL